MNIKLSEIAKIVNAEISGDENIIINNFSSIDESEQGDLTFITDSKYEKYFASCKASAIIVNEKFNKSRNDITYLTVKNPQIAFANILSKYFPFKASLSGIDTSAFIDSSAKIGQNVSVGKNVIISEGCKIGDNTVILHNTVIMQNVEVGNDCIVYPNVTIREGCKLGNRVILHSGVVIGSDGFGYYTDENNVYHKIPQIGIVIIGDDVEIGSNTTIDRAALGATIIGNGTKIDNLVQIAHNVKIGKNTVLSSQVGVSGSTKIGNNCILAGQVGLAGHLEIVDNVILLAKSGIPKTISKPGMYFGYPAKPHREALRLEAHLRNFQNYVDKLKQLEEKISELEDKSGIKKT